MKDYIIKSNGNFIESKDEVIKKYMEYIDVSPKSILTYNDGIKSFFEYLSLMNVKNPSREDIIAFRNKIRDGHTISTTNTYLIAVRNFFSWLSYEGIYKNITENVKGLQDSSEHKRFALSIDECKRILESSQDLRERMIFTIGVSLGLRANEIVNIRLKDFVVKNNKVCLYVLGKARDGKTDYVVVNDNLYTIILDYINKYNIKDYLFTSNRKDDGSKLTTKTIRLIVKDMMRRIGIDSKEYSLHSLRHSFATINLLNGMDIREVSQSLRHKNIQTTQTYAHDLDMQNNKCFDVVSNIMTNN